MFEETTKAALAAPLNAAHIKSRSQSGQNLSYIEGHHAIREANRIFGFDAWHRETFDVRNVQEEQTRGGEQVREAESPIGLLTPLRAHLSANWDSYLLIVLAGFILYAAAFAGERIKERYVPAPSHAYGGTK